MKRQEILKAIRECAASLGRCPSLPQVLEHTDVTANDIRRNFLNYTKALKACGLEGHIGNRALELKVLLADWAAVARKLGKLPTSVEYTMHGKHSPQPFHRRFRFWTKVPQEMREFIEKQGQEKQWADVLEMIRKQEEDKNGQVALKNLGEGKDAVTLYPGRRIYGAAIMAPAMSHGPVNENGVLFAFGTVAERLGFIVNHIQNAFPDGLAMRRTGKDRYQETRIEFEYESRNFLAHGHDAEGCDLIVCWIHNWPECPIEVIELRSVIMEQK